MFNLVLFGAPGSGKGTQSAQLIIKFNLLHLSTGDLLRNEIVNKTSLGLQAEGVIANGQLVSDDIVIGMIKNKVEANSNVAGFLFDGFPRTTEQAKALDVLLKSKNETINLVVVLDVNTQELKKRLLKRGKLSGRPDDADENVIQKRLQAYEANTAIVSKYYDAQSKVVHVNGVGSIDDIFNNIAKEISKVKA